MVIIKLKIQKSKIILEKLFVNKNKIIGLSAQYAGPEVFLNNEKLGQNNEKSGRFGFITRFGFDFPKSTIRKDTNTDIEEQNESMTNELIQNSQKSDVFAFGVVLWEIITRQIPWNNSSYHEIEQSIRFLSPIFSNILIIEQCFF